MTCGLPRGIGLGRGDGIGIHLDPNTPLITAGQRQREYTDPAIGIHQRGAIQGLELHAGRGQDLIEDLRVDLEKRVQWIVIGLIEYLIGHHAGPPIRSYAATVAFREPPGFASLVAPNDKLLIFGQRSLKLSMQNSVDRIGGQRAEIDGNGASVVQRTKSRFAGTMQRDLVAIAV